MNTPGDPVEGLLKDWSQLYPLARIIFEDYSRRNPDKKNVSNEAMCLLRAIDDSLKAIER